MRKLLLLSLCLAACSSKSPKLSTSDARDVLIDRNWIDRMPESTTDRLHVYRFVPTMGGGVFQDRTLYKGTFELFKFKVDGGDHNPTSICRRPRSTFASQFTIEAVDGQKPFDLKLAIFSDPRGPHVYFGMRKEVDLARRGHLLEQPRAAAPVH